MKNLWMWGFLALITVSLNSCIIYDDDTPFGCTHGEGPMVERMINLPPFSGIDLNCSANVFLVQGDVQEVIVRGQSNIIDLLERDVQGGVWDIEFDDCIRDAETLEITIQIPDIDLIRINGSGDVVGLNTFEGAFIELKISGSGEMDLGLNYEQIETKISGSGDIFVTGATDELDLTISGSGDFEGFGLEAFYADVYISGSGNVELTVIDQLDVKITGSGNVYYKGFPGINANITGSGNIVHVD